MKPSKKLMRDFAKVVLPKWEPSKVDGWYILPNKNKRVDLTNWQTVIELAQKWCSENKATMSCCWNKGIGWDFSVHLKNKYGEGLKKSLPTAIMKAVVEAGKAS